MDFEIINSDITAIETECLVIGLEADAALSTSAQIIDKASKGYIQSIIDDGDINGKSGQHLMLRNVSGIAAKRILLVGLGETDKRSDTAHKSFISGIFAQLKNSNITAVTIALDDIINKDADIYRQMRLSVQTICGEFYAYDETKSTKATPPVLETISFAVTGANTEDAEAGILDGTAVANGMTVARDLGNLPGNICTPTYLSKEALELEQGYESISCDILG